MTSREIIIDLIDKDKITGEQAYVLLNDIFKAEMVAVNETLKESKKYSGTDPVWIGGYGLTGTSSIGNLASNVAATTSMSSI